MKRTKKLNIFLSTSGTTAKLASRLKVALKKAGYGVFLYTEDIYTGTNWIEVLESRIEKCDKMIALITPEYTKSRYCMAEYSAAFQHEGMFFPILVIPTKLTSFQGSIQFTNVVQAYAENDWEVVIDKIVNDFIASLNPSFFSSAVKRANEAATTLFDVVGNAVPLFKKRELGIVIANFVQTNNAKYDVATDWLTKMENQFEDIARENNIRFAFSNNTVTTEEQAKNLLKKTKASVVIWGQVSGNIRDGLGEIPELIRVNYTVAEGLPLSEYLKYLLKQQIFVSATDSIDEVNLFKNRILLSSFSTYLRGRGDLDYLMYCLLGFLGKKETEQIAWFSQAIEKLSRTSIPHSTELNLGMILAMRAWCYFKTRQYSKAVKDADTALAYHGYESELSFTMIIVSHFILDIEKNGEQNILALPHPEDKPLWGAQIINFETGEGLKSHHDLAIDWLDRFLEVFPNNVIANFLSGFILEGSSLFSEAVEAYKKTIELDPTFSVAHYQLGNAFHSLAVFNNKPSHFDDSLIAFSNAVRADPANAFAYYGKGLAFQSIGHKREALRCFDKVVELKPRTFASAFGSKKSNDFGNKILDRLLENMYPGGDLLQWVCLQRGKLLYELKQYEKALEDLKKVKDGGRITAQLYMGASYVSLDRYQDAIRSYNNVIKQNSEHLASALASRAWAYYQMGDNATALADLKLSMKHGTLNENAMGLLVYLETQTKS